MRVTRLSAICVPILIFNALASAKWFKLGRYHINRSNQRTSTITYNSQTECMFHCVSLKTECGAFQFVESLCTLNPPNGFEYFIKIQRYTQLKLHNYYEIRILNKENRQYTCLRVDGVQVGRKAVVKATNNALHCAQFVLAYATKKENYDLLRFRNGRVDETRSMLLIGHNGHVKALHYNYGLNDRFQLRFIKRKYGNGYCVKISVGGDVESKQSPIVINKCTGGKDWCALTYKRVQNCTLATVFKADMLFDEYVPFKGHA